VTNKDLREIETAAKRYNGSGTSTVLMLIEEIRRLRGTAALVSERARGAAETRERLRVLLVAASQNNRPAKAVLAAFDGIGVADDD